MFRLVTLSILVILSQFLYAQRGPSPRKKHFNENCFYEAKYSASSRMRFYPFNTGDSITLVSFRYHIGNYPVTPHSIITDSLIEYKSLSRSEVNRLTDILFNNFYIRASRIGSISQCFFPRNAIVFQDKSGKVKETIFLCFQCSGVQAMLKTDYWIPHMCDQKMDKIRMFFVAMGVKYGTDRSVDSYPGETYKEEGIIFPPVRRNKP